MMTYNRTRNATRKISRLWAPAALAMLMIAPGAMARPFDGGDQPQDRETRRQKLIERFDANGDGQLSAEERRAARTTLAEKRAKRRGDRAEGWALEGRERRQRPSREQILERFDIDGDGQLSAEERQEARKAHRERRLESRERRQRPSREQILERFDSDGDGQLSAEERQAARKAHRERRLESRERRRGLSRERALKRFDSDGDGQLSEAERAEARAAMTVHRRLGRFDTNRDRSLSPEESLAALEAIANGERTGDLNGDGSVDEKDATIILERLDQERPGEDD